MPRANSGSILNVSIPMLSPCEQKEIADYLDRKCAEIDRGIENFSGQIETLRELKERLISDTVTGKIDVRKVVIP